jgi:hypothetical protein
MPSTRLPLFERLARLLDPLDPAELHGLLCGLLCADANLDRDRWASHARELLAEDGEFSQPVRDLLSKLLDCGIAQLNAPDGSVTPLLPDDDAPLSQRVDALAAWCQGLLYGLGLGQVEWRGALSEESREFLRDATEIAQVGLDSDESGEVDEIAYAELVEYLRVGLLTVHQDLHPSATPEPSHFH